MIPFLDLAAVNRAHRAELIAAFERVLDGGWYVAGRELDAFETEYAAWCGAEHAIGVGNGLDALALVLRAWGVGPGDEVIVPAHTFIATWLAVTQVGATPVPVDVCPRSGLIDVARIEAVITPRTRALMPVHLYGRPVPMAPLMELARRHGVKVLEDAAQAHGARWNGQRIGAQGDAVAWSFYPGKNLGALGDGGAVTTNDAALAAALRELRNYGSTVKYQHDRIGWNSRLDELQAALLRVKLPSLDAGNAQRVAIARRYHDGLRGIPGLVLPEWAQDADAVWHLYVVRHARREELAQALRLAGVATLVHYPIAPHRQRAYADLHLAPGSFPAAEGWAAEALSLPIGPTQDDATTARVIEAVRAAARALEPVPGAAAGPARPASLVA